MFFKNSVGSYLMQRWFVEFLSLFVPSSSALLSSFAHLSSLLRVEVKYDISSRKS